MKPNNNRVHNFSAGPAQLPLPVLEQIREELFDWRGLGVSVMELSHRSSDFIALANETEADLRELLAIPGNYRVLILSGGARVQFAAIPLNILGSSTVANYVDTGFWSQCAIKEAKKYCKVHVAASAESNQYTKIPDLKTWDLDEKAGYCHFTSNETIHGLEFQTVPALDAANLVADMTSDILSKPLDVSRFAIIYASAQKNLGIAGLTLAIVRDDLLDKEHTLLPSVYSYKVTSEKESMYATPPTFAWYVMHLMLRWMKSEGGVVALAERNQRKARKLYEVIDNSDLYKNNIHEDSRSRMNIPFRLSTPELEQRFLKAADAKGLKYLKGHRAVGGIRASIYNAISEAEVDDLAAFMKEFAHE